VPIFGVIRARFAHEPPSSAVLRRVDHDHVEITDRIEARDADGAARAMDEHLVRLRALYRADNVCTSGYACVRGRAARGTRTSCPRSRCCSPGESHGIAYDAPIHPAADLDATPLPPRAVSAKPCGSATCRRSFGGRGARAGQIRRRHGRARRRARPDPAARFAVPARRPDRPRPRRLATPTRRPPTCRGARVRPSWRQSVLTGGLSARARPAVDQTPPRK
jgi:hypothetical protein